MTHCHDRVRDVHGYPKGTHGHGVLTVPTVQVAGGCAVGMDTAAGLRVVARVTVCACASSTNGASRAGGRWAHTGRGCRCQVEGCCKDKGVQGADGALFLGGRWMRSGRGCRCRARCWAMRTMPRCAWRRVGRTLSRKRCVSPQLRCMRVGVAHSATATVHGGWCCPPLAAVPRCECLNRWFGLVCLSPMWGRACSSKELREQAATASWDLLLLRHLYLCEGMR